MSTQSGKFAYKIIIDSGSTDDTVQQALKYGFEVKCIDKGSFNHGRVRQDLVNLAPHADICVFLTQDAILASADSITDLVRAFDDPKVGMAYGRQLPNLNAKPLETHLRLFNYPPVSEVVSLADIDHKGFKVFFCSNSFAAYRSSVLKEIGGFTSDSIMGEDAIAAAKMLSAGFKKAYVSSATVYHSHSYSTLEEFERYFDTRVFHEQNKWLIEQYGRPTGEGIKFIKSELSYILKQKPTLIFKAIGSIVAKFAGYKLGKYYKSLPKTLVRSLSMHKFYWK